MAKRDLQDIGEETRTCTEGLAGRDYSSEVMAKTSKGTRVAR